MKLTPMSVNKTKRFREYLSLDALEEGTAKYFSGILRIVAKFVFGKSSIAFNSIKATSESTKRNINYNLPFYLYGKWAYKNEDKSAGTFTNQEVALNASDSETSHNPHTSEYRPVHLDGYDFEALGLGTKKKIERTGKRREFRVLDMSGIKQAAFQDNDKGYYKLGADKQERESVLWTETEYLTKTGSWEYNLKKQKLYCTNYVYNLLRIPKENVVDNFFSLTSYLLEEDKGALQESWEQAVKYGKEFDQVCRLVNSAEPAWVRLRGKAIFKDQSIFKIIGTFQDITEYKQNENKLLAAKANAEAITKAKSEFVSFVSHEIRTPLNAIIGLTHLLMQEGRSMSDYKENLQSIHFSSQTLLSLINNTLDFSKGEAGKVELEKVNFKLKDLLRGVYRSLNLRASQKQLDFELLMHEDLPSEVVGDSARLTQILNNLLSNAIKFTEKGSVKLSVDVVYESDVDCVLEFSVADTGIGIPAERQQLVFESFVQNDVSTHRQYGGTGLGLAITKQLIELHKGTIKVVSSPGAGSVFSVCLRYLKPESDMDKLRQAELNVNKQTSLQNVKVLIVDDNPINKMVASKLLMSWQAEVETAENGLVAVEKIRHSDYDLVLMDLYMPVMDGFTAVSEIRNINQHIPIIGLTGSANEEEKNKLLAIGCNDYLIKPFDPNDLYEKLIQHLQPVTA